MHDTLVFQDFPLCGCEMGIARGFRQHGEKPFQHGNPVGRQAARVSAIASQHPALVGNPAPLPGDAQPHVDVLGPPKRGIEQSGAQQRLPAADANTNVHRALTRDQPFESDVARGGTYLHDGSARFRYIPENTGVGIHHIDGRIGFEHRELRCQVLGGPYVVGIERRNILAPRCPDTGVAGPPRALILLAQVNDALAVGFQSLLQILAVRRAVVHHDDFIIFESLCQHRIQGVGDGFGSPIGGNDYADQGGHSGCFRLPHDLQNSTASRTPAAAYAALSAGTAHALRPWVDEGWHGAPAWSLAFRGYMGTPGFAVAGLKDIDRYTYWIMPIYPVAQAIWYRLFSFSLASLRALSIFCGLLGFTWIGGLAARFPPPDRGHLRRVAVHGHWREKNLRLAILLSQTLVAASGLTHPNGGMLSFLGHCCHSLRRRRARLGRLHRARPGGLCIPVRLSNR